MDITSARRAAELEQKVRELSILLEVSRVLNQNLATDRVLPTVLEQALEMLDAEAGTLWILEENGAVIVPRVVFGPAAESLGNIRLRAGEGIVGAVIQSGRGELQSDVRQDPRWARHVDEFTGFRTRSMISAPLNSQNGTIGCLQLVNKRNGNPFGDSDLHLLMALGTQAALVIENARLLEQTRALTRRLKESWVGNLAALTGALATRDGETHGHSQRTVELAVRLAKDIGVSESELSGIARGALLHDVGKIGIPDHILFKPGRYTAEEREIMKQHVMLGHQMLENIEFLKDAIPVVLYQHEDYDGTGYMAGLQGEEIPLGARIFRVVDVYDALTSERPYKRAWTHRRAMAELNRLAGSKFDPKVVSALNAIPLDQVQHIRSLTDFTPETWELLVRYPGGDTE